MSNDLLNYRFFTTYLDEEVRKAYIEYNDAYDAIRNMEEHPDYDSIKAKLLDTYNSKIAHLKRQDKWLKDLIIAKAKDESL